jgi:uncharacterized protein with FMN-binding domain
MRRITLAVVSTVASLVLLFSYRTSTGGAAPASAPAAAPGVVPDTSSAPASPGSQAPKTVTVNGTVAQTQWGPVQVQVRIVDGRITDVRTLRHPSGNSQDEQINGYALPRLRAEVLDAQSARIDTVSGATVTSDGYLSSLQSALDAAHFG